MLTARPAGDRLALGRHVNASRRSRPTGGHLTPPPGFMNSRLIFALVGAGALAFACSPRPRSQASQGSHPAALASALPFKTAAPVERAPRHTAATTKTEAKLDSHFDVTVDPRVIHFALGVKNVGKKHVELTFPSGKSYDFV